MGFFDLFKKKSALELSLRAQLYFRAGKFSEAIREYTKAIKIAESKHGEAYYYQKRADALTAIIKYQDEIKFGQTKYLNDDKALADYSKAIELYYLYLSLNNNVDKLTISRVAEAYYERGHLKYFIGDEKGAHQDALEAQKLGHPPSDLIELTSKYIKE